MILIFFKIVTIEFVAVLFILIRIPETKPMSGQRKIECSLVYIITPKHADFDGGLGTRPPDLDDDDDDDVCGRYQLVLSRFNTLYYSII